MAEPKYTTTTNIPKYLYAEYAKTTTYNPCNSDEVHISGEEVNSDFKKDACSKVNHPSHYNQGGIEAIDAIAAACVGLEGEEAFCTGNAIKYLFRWKHKNGKEDLEKAIWYINRMLMNPALGKNE